ncbi:hypothetical protein KEM48_014610 [Puccinia striiformis f. sp. tritici PST-130]|nr:hypothetical protein KEM48_014610 [Puccinia striiformis f. sp. tritici PST-130]
MPVSNAKVSWGSSLIIPCLLWSRHRSALSPDRGLIEPPSLSCRYLRQTRSAEPIVISQDVSIVISAILELNILNQPPISTPIFQTLSWVNTLKCSEALLLEKASHIVTQSNRSSAYASKLGDTLVFTYEVLSTTLSYLNNNTPFPLGGPGALNL